MPFILLLFSSKEIQNKKIFFYFLHFPTPVKSLNKDAFFSYNQRREVHIAWG